ncbi:helix-turn-helix domain-containing protein [Jeotgalibaca sp. MA1X17-3]|uniref:helix-turn-helix domain-containing protein n=1 Tax=Jeotgalibaca sp. MA1X17-3 TaxID=2908211 RepID=UPI001F41316E|nr:helix-turn-helix transcriptional regulator [Jeotgalibaca sp. MA1X17-3]UJF15771.1 helix-turn-helix domain-containing protein [Jeotgalibaca sp. MA1X17-3]
MTNQRSKKDSVGEVLKKVRLSKNYTQKFVTNGIIGQPTYSKIERGEVDPTYLKFISILKRLDISEEEFHFLLDENVRSEREKIIEEFFLLNFNDASSLTKIKEKIRTYLDTQNDYILNDIYYICEALILISIENNYKMAITYANKVWNRLEKFDQWYLMEIRLINAILFIFPTESAVHIAERIVAQLKNYDTRESKVLLNNIQSNLGLLLIKNKEYELALGHLNELILKFKLERNYYYLAIIYIRKGIIMRILDKKSKVDFIKKGLNLVRAFEEPELEKALRNEIEFYTKKE